MADNLNQMENDQKKPRDPRKVQDQKHQRWIPARGRNFDRKSGTGFGFNKQSKRSGGGAYNWGGDIDKEMIEDMVEEVHAESH